MSLTKPVAAGDLLVGWFAQYASSGQVQVSDKVNGAWTRASSSEKFGSQGDIALYYLAGSEGRRRRDHHHGVGVHGDLPAGHGGGVLRRRGVRTAGRDGGVPGHRAPR